MIKIYFIRHLKTKGNYEKRYIGRTDESLYEVEKQTLLTGLKGIQTVYSSPMKRCIETARLLAPDITPVIVEGFKEIDFGEFENKCYEELKDDPDYISFIASNGTGSIPLGENAIDFKNRCCNAFAGIVQSFQKNSNPVILIVSHGGTIMSIFERYEVQQRGFYDYQVKNGCGYEAEYNPETNQITIIKELIE